ASTRKVIGSLTSITSPLCHSRSTFTYDPGFEEISCGLPFTVIEKLRPAESGTAHDGYRILMASLAGFADWITSRVEPVSGNRVSWRTTSPFSRQFNSDGMNRFT